MPRTQVIRALDALLQASLMVFAFSLTVGIALTQISLGVAIAVWLARWAVTGRWPGSATALDTGLGFFLGACILSSFLSVNPAESFAQLKKFYLVTAFYLLSWTIRDIRQVGTLVSLFLAGAALTAGIGLVKHFLGFDPRLVGTQTMAMTSGGVYQMASLVAVALLMRKSAQKRGAWAAASWAAATVITAGLLFTKTVSAWLGWAAGLMLAFSKHRWLRAVLALSVVVLIALIVAGNQAMYGFLTVDKPGSMQVRLNQWRMGWHLFQERPITGYGMIDLQGQYRNIPYDNPYWHEAITTGHLHNNFVHIAVTTGLIGLLGFGWLWVSIFRLLAGAVRQATDGHRQLARGFLACAVGFTVSGFFEWNFGDSEPVTIIWFILGLASTHRGFGPRSSNA